MEPILELVLCALHKNDTFDAAVDALVKIVSHPELQGYVDYVCCLRFFVVVVVRDGRLGLEDLGWGAGCVLAPVH